MATKEIAAIAAAKSDKAEKSLSDANNKNRKNGQPSGEYTAENIKVLEGLEAVRLRPAMYIGSTGELGLHQRILNIGSIKHEWTHESEFQETTHKLFKVEMYPALHKL